MRSNQNGVMAAAFVSAAVPFLLCLAEFSVNVLLSLLILRRGLAPQNKPELQKVLEKRKREQILKAQKEEQEAHKKRSDLEIELMKRQQKLEQVINEELFSWMFASVLH